MFVKSLPQHVPSIFIFPPATLVACLFILSNTSSVHGQAAFNNLGGGGGAGGGMGMTGGGISSQQFLGNNNGVPNSNTFNDIGGDGGPLNTSSPSLGGNADGVGMVGGGLGPNGVSPLGSNGPTNTGKNSGGNIPPSPIGGGMNNNNNGPAANRGIPYQCSGTSFRKEVRDMASDGQLQSFVTAFKQLATDGTLAKFVNWHSPNKGGYWDFAHFTPRFLPWHRLFIKEFEKALVNAGAPYLPYWDWTVDSQEPWKSLILSELYFGQPDPLQNNQIKNSPFQASSYTCPVGGGPLIRNYPAAGPTSAFYHASLIRFDLPSFSQFSQTLEYGPHAVVHSVLGGPTGEGGQLSSWMSPDDPIFWLHHSFLDKLWAKYQSKNAANLGGFDGQAYSLPMDSSEIMQPWNVAVQNILNINNVCVNYVDPSAKVLNSGPLTNNITAPDIGHNWFNGTKANGTIAEQVARKVNQLMNNVNTQISNGENVPTTIANTNPPNSPSRPNSAVGYHPPSSTMLILSSMMALLMMI